MYWRVGIASIAVLSGLLLAASSGQAFAQDAPKGAPAAEKLGWHLGCQAYSFNRFTFYEAIDKNQSLGLHYIEAYPGQKLSPEKPDVTFDHNASPEVREEVLAKLEAADVKLVNYGVVGLPNDEAESRKVFEFAKAMGIETLTSEPPEEQLDLVEKLCDEYGVNVAIHNHPLPSHYWNPETVLAAVEGRSKRMGACADTGHWLRSGLDPLECLKKLEGRIISLHFKDLNKAEKAETPKNERTAHDVPWGTGVADVPALLAELKRQNFKGVFSIEYEHNWDNSVPEIRKSIRFFNRTAGELSK